VLGAELIETLPPGDAGTFTTLRVMAQLARRPRPEVVAFAQQAGAGLPLEQAVARLFVFVRDKVANDSDPQGIEWLQAPHVTLFENPAGDCDDKATLLAALLRSIGVPVRFAAIAISGRQLGHVYVEAQLPGHGWLALDPKNPRAPVGWCWPNPARLERLEV
jgi:transglutaminase-like putative cysteine protease